MRSLRQRVRRAVLAAVSASTLACGSRGSAPGSSASGSLTPSNSTGGSQGIVSTPSTSGGQTTTGSQGVTGGRGTSGSTIGVNLCDQCTELGMTCNVTSTACVSWCTWCPCESFAVPVGPTDGGYPDGGLNPGVCGIACGAPSPFDPDGGVPSIILSCSILDGGCPALADGGDAGAACVECTTLDCNSAGQGRRPSGLCETGGPDSTALANHLARSAWLEAASVVAFERLEQELSARGAPRGLIRRAQRAAEDERRHAQTMSQLCIAAGAAIPPVQTLPQRPRPLLSIALENAREGCVGETVGAALCLWQSLHAPDASVRSAMAGIAEDELRHADLSWDVATWLEPQLTKVERLTVRQAMLQARAEVFGLCDDRPPHELGLPNRADRARLIEELNARVFRHRDRGPANKLLVAHAPEPYS